MLKKICKIFVRHSALDARIFYKEARTLRDAGYDVHIICRLKNGSFSDVKGRSLGMPDENGEWKYDGVTFHGVPKRYGLLGKWREYKDIVKIGVNINAAVYHCHEFDIALAASIKIKKTLGGSTELIYDMHEYWPGLLMKDAHIGLKNISYWLYRLWEKRAFRLCSYIITANSVVRGYVLFSNRRNKVEVLLNVPELTVFNENLQPDNNKSDYIVVCHEGELLFKRGLKDMIFLLKNKTKLGLRVIGDIYGEERKWLNNELKLDVDLSSRLHITGWLPYEKVGDALSDCDIGLILFYPTMNNILGGPPNKLFNYMRYGMPVISVDLPEVRVIISKYKCGLILSKLDGASIEKAVTYLIEHPEEAKIMGQNGKNAVLKELCWAKEGEKLLRIYDELLNPKPFLRY